MGDLYLERTSLYEPNSVEQLWFYYEISAILSYDDYVTDETSGDRNIDLVDFIARINVS